MNKNIDTSFINHIIDYNFLFLNTKLNNKKPHHTIKSEITLLSNQNEIQILELEQLIKSLKQMARTLRFLKESRRNHTLFLDIENSYISRIIDIFIKKNKKVLDKIKIERIYDYKPNDFLFAILNLNNITSNRKYDIFLRKNYYIIHNLSDSYNHNNAGNYKIFNNLEDWKKLIFFLMFIKKNYSKTKKL